VDPYDSDQILNLVSQERLNLRAVMNTHEHADHWMGNEGIADQINCDFWAHPNAISKIAKSKLALRNGDKISLGKDFIQVLDTPGHTLSHVSLLGIQSGQANFVLTGDTIFNAGVGNCKKGGDPEILYNTVCNIFGNLPDSVKLYPGHDYMETNLKFALSILPENSFARTLLEEIQTLVGKKQSKVTDFGLERKINPFFQLDHHTLHKNLESKHSGFDSNLITLKTEREIFLALRRLRDLW
jgi:hydroxyacylglutathione hydrolase